MKRRRYSLLVFLGALIPLVLPPPLVQAPSLPTGKAPIELLIEGFRAPTGIAVSPEGTLFFTDEKEGSLFERQPNGTFFLLVNRLKKPRGIARSEDGTLFVAAERLKGHWDRPPPRGLLLSRSPDGTLTLLASDFKMPEQIALEPDGHLLLSTTGGLRRAQEKEHEDDDEDEDHEEKERKPPGFPGTIFRMSPTGQIARSYPGFRHPSGLVVARGAILVAAEGSKTAGPPLKGSLFQIDSAGQVALFLTERFKRPTGLVQDVLGQFYLAVKGERRHHEDEDEDEGHPEGGLILKVTPQGSFTTFAQGFERPWGLALDPNGNLYVSDPRAGRIFRFLAPKPPTLAALPAATNQPQMTLSGKSEAEAKLTVRGGSQEVSTLADPQGNFSLNVLLQLDKTNTLQVYTTGVKGEGLTGAPATTSILQDSASPAVAFFTPSAGQRLSGSVPVEIIASDTLSGIATVELLLDGVLQGSRSAPPFTFSLDTARFAAGPHTLTARAFDRAGNGASVSIPVEFGGLRVTITEPTDGAVVPVGSLLVRGTVEAGGVEVGVTINGVAAAVQGTTFAALVPVAPETTTLTALATSATGTTASHSVNIIVSGTSGVTLLPSPQSGVAPLAVAFSLLGGPVPTQVELDADGNGTVDFRGASLEGQTFTYTQAGIYSPRATVTDVLGNRFFASAVVQVFDATTLDALLQAKWTAMKDALRSGDIPRAVSHITTRTRSDYEAAFRIIAARLPNVDSILTNLTLIKVRNGTAICEATRTDAELVKSFEVRFAIDHDGVWRIEAF